MQHARAVCFAGVQRLPELFAPLKLVHVCSLCTVQVKEVAHVDLCIHKTSSTSERTTVRQHTQTAKTGSHAPHTSQNVCSMATHRALAPHTEPSAYRSPSCSTAGWMNLASLWLSSVDTLTCGGSTTVAVLKRRVPKHTQRPTRDALACQLMCNKSRPHGIAYAASWLCPL